MFGVNPALCWHLAAVHKIWVSAIDNIINVFVIKVLLEPRSKVKQKQTNKKVSLYIMVQCIRLKMSTSLFPEQGMGER